MEEKKIITASRRLGSKGCNCTELAEPIKTKASLEQPIATKTSARGNSPEAEEPGRPASELETVLPVWELELKTSERVKGPGSQ